MAYCKKSGEILNTDASYCPSCGEPTSKSNEVSQENNVTKDKSENSTQVSKVALKAKKTRLVHKRKKDGDKVNLSWWTKIALVIAILVLIYSLMVLPDTIIIALLNFVGAVAIICGLVSAFRGKIEMDGIKVLLIVSFLWFPIMKGLDYLLYSREKDKVEHFRHFEDALPSNGGQVFIAEETKPYGSKNVTLKRVVLYEKNDERDYTLEGVTSSGRAYSEKGEWFPDESETHLAVEYNYTKMCAGNILTECTNYYIDDDGYIYFCTGIIDSSEDVANAFKRGAIAKLRVASDEEAEEWRQGKPVEHEGNNVNTIAPKTPEEKEYAQAGYSAGAEFGAIGGLMGGFGGVLDLADAVGVSDEELDGAIRNSAISSYDEKYENRTGSNQDRLKEIFIQSYIEGFKSKVKADPK